MELQQQVEARISRNVSANVYYKMAVKV